MGSVRREDAFSQPYIQPSPPNALTFEGVTCRGTVCSMCKRPVKHGVRIDAKGGEGFHIICRRCIRSMGKATGL